MWEVSPQAEVVPVLTSVSNPSYQETILDVDATFRRWATPIVQGSSWVGCHLDEAARWVVAAVRAQPAAPPPAGIERRCSERLTLELAGLCLGLIDRPSEPLSPRSRPRMSEPDALFELARQPSVIAHEVANPLTAAMASLELCADSVRAADPLDQAFRAQLLEELGSVAEGMEQAVAFLRAIQDRARGGLARSERFDATQVVRSCVTLERPLARKSGVALQGATPASSVFLQGEYGVRDQFVEPAYRRRDDREADGHGLEDGDAEGLGTGRGDEHVGRRKRRG